MFLHFLRIIDLSEAKIININRLLSDFINHWAEMLDPSQRSTLNMRMRREIRGYNEVREAARDWETYSSDLLGDRDVRDYRQLPLEADPPRHTKFRMALNPVFSPGALRPLAPDFEALASRLIADLKKRTNFEVLEDLVIPYVIGCLTIIYKRPQDFDEWRSWGPDVWTAAAYKRGEDIHAAEEAHRNRDFNVQSPRSGEVLQAYLDRVFDEAETRVAAGEAERDIWDFVAGLDIDGQRVDRKEMQGIANVLLAGGRDTVIKLLTGFVWHLIEKPSDADFIRDSEEHFRPAIQEMARYLSPLPRMERVPREHAVGIDADRDPEKYVLLGFLSANHDPERFENPEVIDFERERNAHIAFGFGPHSCLGQNITEIETIAFLKALLPELRSWEFSGEPNIVWVDEPLANGQTTRYLDKFKALYVSAT
jgi:cytochrome P450